MADALNLFPDRAAIGRTPDGQPVHMTQEFSRALAALLVRVGGPVGIGMDELANELAAAGASALGAQLAHRMEELERQIDQAGQLLGALGELRKFLDGVAIAGVNVATPTDWEHPGAIGARKPNSGQFTTVNRVTITAPTAHATLTLADGKTLTASNTLTLAGNDGATLDIGAGGTLKSAAFKAEGDAWALGQFGCNGKPAQGPAASGGTLPGVIAALVACGILAS